MDNSKSYTEEKSTVNTFDTLGTPLKKDIVKRTFEGADGKKLVVGQMSILAYGQMDLTDSEPAFTVSLLNKNNQLEGFIQLQNVKDIEELNSFDKIKECVSANKNGLDINTTDIPFKKRKAFKKTKSMLATRKEELLQGIDNFYKNDTEMEVKKEKNKNPSAFLKALLSKGKNI